MVIAAASVVGIIEGAVWSTRIASPSQHKGRNEYGVPRKPRKQSMVSPEKSQVRDPGLIQKWAKILYCRWSSMCSKEPKRTKQSKSNAGVKTLPVRTWNWLYTACRGLRRKVTSILGVLGMFVVVFVAGVQSTRISVIRDFFSLPATWDSALLQDAHIQDELRTLS
jgi:hypothetical protein